MSLLHVIGHVTQAKWMKPRHSVFWSTVSWLQRCTSSIPLLQETICSPQILTIQLGLPHSTGILPSESTLLPGCDMSTLYPDLIDIRCAPVHVTSIGYKQTKLTPLLCNHNDSKSVTKKEKKVIHIGIQGNKRNYRLRKDEHVLLSFGTYALKTVRVIKATSKQPSRTTKWCWLCLSRPLQPNEKLIKIYQFIQYIDTDHTVAVGVVHISL